MREIPLNFDPAGVRREIDREIWEGDRRAVGLGHVWNLTPSGKVYMPWACGNVELCPVCQGAGEVRGHYKPRVVRKWKNVARRTAERFIRWYGPAFGGRWPESARAKMARINKVRRRFHTDCPRCAGIGSAEAHDDEVWAEMAETALASVGLSLELSDGDGSYYIAVEYREPREEDENDDDD